ncbi:MAG: L-serine ammonia-lyase, iron-sulfur-dependent, subunit alpha [Lachnospiraceae bacterium]|nr:L-serine ammonia-lyase, iron-sulfur-dependent, subunit alpha [Lachnospiraceae bacterium]
MSFRLLQEICDRCKNEEKEFWQIVMEDDSRERGVTAEESFQTMRNMYHDMKRADQSYKADRKSASGLVGGEGAKMEAYRLQGKTLLGDFATEVMEKAIKMGESNACMRRIVAAPTAGSCGVLPAVLLTYQTNYKCSEETMTKALFVAAGIGEVLAESASIAGAEGGCQAEIGSAAAMAAGSIAYLEGSDATGISHAAALTLKSLLGLTCDPVAGLVEVPCVKRNATGAMVALAGVQMVLAGIKSVIPPDEVVDTMYRIGNQLPACLRETGEGGLAVTPTAKKVEECLNKGCPLGE